MLKKEEDTERFNSGELIKKMFSSSFETVKSLIENYNKL